MSEKRHYATAPEDRVHIGIKIVYGIGSLVNNLLGAAVGCMSIVLVLGLGMNPALVGLLMSLPRLFDAFIDPIIGYVSDHTRTRFGRRRPYIFFGAIFAGILFALMWQLPAGHNQSFYFWFFLMASMVWYIGYSLYSVPWVALGYELTSDYHERTQLMGYSSWIGQFAWVIAPWFYKIMENKEWFPDSVQGARALAIMVGVFVIGAGVLPAIFCREKLAAKSGAGKESTFKWSGILSNITDFFQGCAITLKSRPFLKLCTATFLVFNGFMLISGFSSYIIIYYVFGGDKGMGATYMGYFGTVSSIATFCVIPLVTWISSKVGKRKAFIFSTSLSIVGYAVKWFCYNPRHPWLVVLPAPLIAFGLGGLFTLMGAMIADVCDLDELKTGKRREGMFGSIYWWMVKLGMALAFALAGPLLNATGFEVALEGNQTVHTLLWMRIFDICTPILTSAIAMWAVVTFDITEESAHATRSELEKRRGKPA